MDIEIKTTYKIEYKVEYFEGNEGGMDTGQFGNAVETISEAISLLEIALKSNSHEYFENNLKWIITIEIKKTVKEI